MRTKMIYFAPFDELMAFNVPETVPFLAFHASNVEVLHKLNGKVQILF